MASRPPSQPNGITWLELFILFEITGSDYRWTKEAAKEELEEALKNGDDHAKRWQQKAGKQNKTMAKMPEKKGLAEKQAANLSRLKRED